MEAGITTLRAAGTTFRRSDFSVKDRVRADDRIVHLMNRRAQHSRWLENWTVLLCMQDNEEVRFLLSWVGERGGLAIRTGRCRELVDFFVKPKDYPCMILLEVTDDADINDVIDRCLELRAVSPASPIILLSREFGQDELSTLRLEICDASLRMPVLQSAFEDVVLHAIQNNGTYCHRKNIQRPFTTREMMERLRPADAIEEDDPEAIARSGQWFGPALLLGMAFWAAALVWLFS